MLKRIFEIVPAQSLIFFSICVASILVFIVLIIVPSQKTTAELDTRIEELEKRNAEQSALTPVFYTLLAKAKARNASQLPTTEKKKLARGDMKKISAQIHDIVQRNGLELEEISPDLNSLKENSAYLLMNLVIKGDFFDFRKLLIDLNAMPSLAHIQEMRIRSVEESREIKLKIWLAQE
jgi:Tfp pilus assembly protein PilO